MTWFVLSFVQNVILSNFKFWRARMCASWRARRHGLLVQFSLSHIDDIGRYQLSISIFYFKVPGCVGRVTSASAVPCICMYVDGANIGWSMTTMLAELSNEIRWRTKDKYKIGLLFSDISEIHAVLAVLCEIDKATSLHACMPCSAGCGRTGSKRANRNILNVDIDSWYRPISNICDSEN